MANLVLGTMTFGQQTFDEEAAVMLKTALHNGITEFDTAYVYNDGECERLLGRVLGNFDAAEYRIATKVNPRVTGRLDREAILMQFHESLRRLQMDAVDVLYLHFPDHLVPLEEMLFTCDELYRAGEIKELGISNYPASEVDRACKIAKANGWITPSVYEGLYNALNRKVEDGLFESIRKHDMRFTAYNPLAGGLLTGKYHSIDETPTDGRFAKRPGYKNRYWKESYFRAVDLLRVACEEAEIRMVEAAFRWLAYHSALSFAKGDAIIIGASKPQQLIENVNTVDNGPLPAELVQAFEDAWAICMNDARDYYVYQN